MNNRFGVSFHHLGLAVKSERLPSARDFLEGLGYSIGDLVVDAAMEVRLVWCRHASMPDVEIVMPDGDHGPLASILSGRSEALYHQAYTTKSAADSIEKMRLAGIRVILVRAAAPALLFGNRKVSFFYLEGTGLIELIEVPCPEEGAPPAHEP